MEVNIPTESTAEILIRYGLYIGALFQLICVAAVMVLPDKAPDSIYGKSGDISEDEMWSESTAITPRHGHHRMKKQDKKKRK